MKKHTRLTFGLLATLMLSACGGTPTTDLYVLRPSDSASLRCTPPMAIQIDRPVAAEEFASKKIAVMFSDSHLNYYTGAGWASSFPDQLRDYLQQDFLNHDGITLATDDTADSKKLRTLSITIQEAFVENPDAPRVHLRMVAVLHDGEHVLKQVRINEVVTPTENHMPEIVAAFDQAAANSSAKIRDALHLRCK